MKRLFLLSMLCVLAAGVWAQGDLDSTYHAFVQPGKLWRVHGFSMGSHHTVTDYYFKHEEPVTRNGQEYRQMYSRQNQGNARLEGLLREENRQVYLYNESVNREYKLYDFNLQVGDEFEPEYGDFTRCKVTSVGRINLNGVGLKTITMDGYERYGDPERQPVEVTWTECVGNFGQPLDGLSGERISSWFDVNVYTLTSDFTFLPSSFDLAYNGWHGQQLKLYGYGEFGYDLSQKDQLTYELIPTSDPDVCTLHVSGQMCLSTGPNHYIYCVVEPTEQYGNYKITFQIEDVAPISDGLRFFNVDFYVPFFLSQHTYIAVDERGEHQVVRTDAYRPFIEKDKVWKLGYFPERRYEEGEEPIADRIEYQYFDGDTVVAGRHCSRWMRTEMDADGSEVSYAGAAFEDGHRVYIALPGRTDFQLLYDFNNRTDTFFVCDNSAAGTFGRQDVEVMTTASTAVETETFKGLLKTVYMMDYLHRLDVRAWVNWRQGVGYKGLYNVALENPMDEANPQLMSCSVGGDVLYLNRQLHDGVNPTADCVKTQRLDFTHTVKTRPKAPGSMNNENGTVNNENGEGNNEEADGGQELTGEYSESQLLVNLQPLKGICAITIQNDANQIVSTRQVQATTLIAVTEDLTMLPIGRYTVCVENSDEAYTATFTLPLDGTSVRSPQMLNGKSVNPKWFDLTGRRLTAPPVKGIYIENGQKKVVR